MKVDRYVEPAEFEKWKQVAEDMGFLYVASGPLVRSSYKVCYLLLTMLLSFLSRLTRLLIFFLIVGWRVFHRERSTKEEPAAREGGQADGRLG